MKETIVYQEQCLPLIGKWDVIIVGGGSAGASAGITAARGGSRTLIVDKNIRLGGTSTNALVSPMMKSFTGHYSNFFDIEHKMNALGITTRDEIGTEMLWFTAEAMEETLETLYTEAGGEILYDAVLAGCLKEEGKIRYLVLATVEGLCAVEGERFVDASGDAVLARAAEVPVFHGDENGNNQITSLRFEMGGIDVEKYRDYVMSLHDIYSIFPRGYFYESAMVGGRNFVLEPLFQKGVKDGVLKQEDLRYYQNFSLPGKPGCMTFNCPHLTELKDNTSAVSRSRAVIEGHAMIYRMVRFLKGYMPGFEHAYLTQEASMLGIRESYRMVGKYVLTEEDYSKQSRFDDGIARGDWYIDVHSATKGLFHQNTYKEGDYYEIPYRSMVCEEVENLIVAGRCISTTFLMQASIRIIPTCIDMGQAAGEACLYSDREHVSLNRIEGAKLREHLIFQYREKT